MNSSETSAEFKLRHNARYGGGSHGKHDRNQIRRAKLEEGRASFQDCIEIQSDLRGIGCSARYSWQAHLWLFCMFNSRSFRMLSRTDGEYRGGSTQSRRCLHIKRKGGRLKVSDIAA